MFIVRRVQMKKIIPKGVKISITIFCIIALSAISIFSCVKIYEYKLYNKILEMPVLSINTENGKSIVSKEEYINCEVSVTNADEKFTFQNRLGKIRGRGNSTWTESNKKPYRLKFEEKTDLFGNGKSKTWTLIANYQDNSGIRNHLAYKIGHELDDLNFTTTTHFVDLWLNGKYVGVYLVCEQIEAGKNRVEIEEDLSLGVDVGYLIEQDFRAPYEGVAGVDYFACENRYFALKYPKTDNKEYTTDHLNFIKNYFEQCFVALKGDNFADVENLIDINTFADSYFINELFKNTDVDSTSFFLYKDSGGKLCSGPIWDYDSAGGNSPKEHDNETNALVAIRNIFYSYLLKFDEFKTVLKNKIDKYYEVINNLIENECNYIKTEYKESFKRNYRKWKCSYRGEGIKGWEKHVDFVECWLKSSLNNLKSYYC